MRKSNLTNVDVEKKMTAGVRHAKTFCTVTAILMAALYVAMLVFDEAKHSGECLTIAIGFMLGRWFFGGMESIISLLYANGEAIGKIKLPEKVAVQPVAEKKAETKPMTQDDPAHWPKQEPMETGIDVAAALRVAEDLDRN